MTTSITAQHATSLLRNSGYSDADITRALDGQQEIHRDEWFAIIRRIGAYVATSGELYVHGDLITTLDPYAVGTDYARLDRVLHDHGWERTNFPGWIYDPSTPDTAWWPAHHAPIRKIRR